MQYIRTGYRYLAERIVPCKAKWGSLFLNQGIVRKRFKAHRKWSFPGNEEDRKAVSWTGFLLHLLGEFGCLAGLNRFSGSHLLGEFSANLNNCFSNNHRFLLPHSWLLIARGFSTKRVSMGLWLLRLTVKMLANLRITVSIFPLWSPESFFKVFNFFDE